MGFSEAKCCKVILNNKPESNQSKEAPMISVLRKIRKRLLERNKFYNYLLYAIGEIFLVVIGIIIALSLNNWNSKRLENNDIQEYYGKLIEELDLRFKSEKRAQIERDSLINQIISLQETVKTSDVDSLILAKINLKALLGDVHYYNIKYPIFEEFLGKNYFSKINNLEIKLWAKNLNQMINSHAGYNAYSTDQSQNIIMPFIMDHINYSTIVEYPDETQSVEGGPETNYTNLIKNIKFWNILSLRLEILQNHNSLSIGATAVTLQLKLALEDELNKDRTGAE